MTTAEGSYLTIVFSGVGVMGVDDLTVIVSFGVPWVLPDGFDVTVLQFVSNDVALSGMHGAVWPVFAGRVLGYPSRSVGMWIVFETMSK